MPTGTCALCRTKRELQKSHLLPAAYYRLARKAGEKNPNPILVTPKVTLKTSKQVQTPLLCRRCERRFNEGGEDWILKNAWRSDQDFPIQSALHAAQPVYASSEGQLFACEGLPGILPRKLGYFACSVFWRAAVHQWPPIVGHVMPRIDLGPYEDALRLFLLEEQPLPDTVAILASVVSASERAPYGFAMFPFQANRRHTYRQYCFSIPGIRFDMLTGRALPPAARQVCVVHSKEGFVSMSLRMDAGYRTGILDLLEKSRVAGSLD